MIARKSLLILSSTFIIKIIAAIEFIIIIKFWGDFAPTAIGTIGLAISFLALFNIVSNLGFRAAHIKRISEGKDLGTCIGTFLTIKIILTVIMIIISLTSIFIIKNFFGEVIYDARTESIIFIFLMMNIINNLITIPIVTFTGKKEMVKREFPYIFGSIIILPLFIIIIAAGVSEAKIPPIFIWPIFLKPLQQFIADNALKSLSLVYFFSSLTIFIISLWFFRKYPIKKPNWIFFKSYFKFALPMMFLPVITIVINNIDKLMIGYFWSPIEVGYYFAMLGVVSIVFVLSSSVSIVLFPSISEFNSKKDFFKIKELIVKAERYISMISIFFIVIIIVFARQIISIIMSDVFLPATPALIILSIYIFIVCLNSLYNSLIKGMNKPLILTKIAIATCLITIALNFIFIPKNGLFSSFGITGASGAATAVSVSSLVAFFIIRIIAKKLADIKIWHAHIIIHIFAGTIMGIILYVIAFYSKLFTFIDWYHLIFFITIGIAIYLTILFLLKEFTKQDIDFFLDILHPKKLLRYIKSELNEEIENSNKK